MNIEQAKTISIVQILKNLHIKPVKETEKDATYVSPIRNENTGSFHVNKEKNLWYDHGISIGGDVIDFGREYLKYHKSDYNIPDVLQWVRNMSGSAPSIKPIILPVKKENTGLILQSVAPLTDRRLINYLNERGIPLETAAPYLKTARIFNTKKDKEFTALGFKNSKGGYELRNARFKGCIGPKDVTFIRGKDPERTGIHLFEGFMDFLTILWLNKIRRFKDDALILNSLACLEKAVPYFNSYTYKFAYSWMDNDPAGEIAKQRLSEFFATHQSGVQHKPMNYRYRPLKDVNARHMHELGLS